MIKGNFWYIVFFFTSSKYKDYNKECVDYFKYICYPVFHTVISWCVKFMKNILVINLLIIILIAGFSFNSQKVYAQNRYSIDQKIKKRKQHRSRKERYEDRKVKRSIRKKRKEARRIQRKYKRKQKRYIRRKPGRGKEALTGKKVRKRMRRSRRIANYNRRNKLPFYKRIFRRKKRMRWN